MITINGKVYAGTNVIMNGCDVIIDGKKVDDTKIPDNVLVVQVEGTITNLTTDKAVSCQDVRGDVKAGGSVNCSNIGGSAHAGGSVNAEDIGGNVNSGGSVNCDDVHGDVYARGSVSKS